MGEDLGVYTYGSRTEVRLYYEDKTYLQLTVFKEMTMNKQIRNPMAVALQSKIFKGQKIKSKKGKGSYTRKSKWK